MLEYKIVEADCRYSTDIKKFELLVNTSLQEGWKLHGSTILVVGYYSTMYAQPMTREVEIRPQPLVEE